MIQSKITGKAQTTVPRAVRSELQLGAGDSLRWEIEGDRVIVSASRAEPRISVNGPTSSIASTTIFNRGDIVRVPFPHVERAIVVVRPALVISVGPIGFRVA